MKSFMLALAFLASMLITSSVMAQGPGGGGQTNYTWNVAENETSSFVDNYNTIDFVSIGYTYSVPADKTGNIQIWIQKDGTGVWYPVDSYDTQTGPGEWDGQYYYVYFGVWPNGSNPPAITDSVRAESFYRVTIYLYESGGCAEEASVTFDIARGDGLGIDP